MIRRPTLSLALAALFLQATPAFAQEASAYQFDPVLADYQQVPVGARRQVTAARLEVRTRPIPEAAVLDVLRAGAHVGVVSEGGGWATMDLGGGFLGWMRADGLGAVTEAPAARQAKVAPIPADPSRRPASLASATPAAIAVHAHAYVPPAEPTASAPLQTPLPEAVPKRRF